MFWNENSFGKLEKLQQKIENETGLCILKMQTEKQLDFYLNSGLAALYRDVFGGPPYSEKFTLEEVRDIFCEYLKKDGQIFVALEDKTGSPVAFVVSVPLKTEFNVAALAGSKINVKKAAYFAEDGVAESFRRKALSEKMKKLLLEACRLGGFREVLLRTSAVNYAQISAVNKAGGMVVKGLFQDIARKRVDGTTQTDRNAFYRFDGSAKTIDKIDSVTIVRDVKGRDTAIVGDPSFKIKPAGWRSRLLGTDWEKEIQQTYPGISEIRSGVSGVQGEIVFKGRLYFASYEPPSPGALDTFF